MNIVERLPKTYIVMQAVFWVLIVLLIVEVYSSGDFPALAFMVPLYYLIMEVLQKIIL
jgi:hypothetical protein